MALILKKFLYFLLFRKTETSKKIPHILRNGNLKKLLIFQEMELLSQSSKTKQNKQKKIHPNKISYILRNRTFWV